MTRGHPLPQASHRKKPGRLGWRRFFPVFLILISAWGSGCCPVADQPLVVFGSPDSPRLRQVAAALEAGLAPQKLQVWCVPEFGPEGEEAVKKLRAQKPRLIIALGSPALLRLAPVEKGTPIVFAMVTDPYVLGVAEDPRQPEVHQKNVTGLASPPPLDRALEQGARLFGPCPWGLLYDPRDGMAAEVAQAFANLAPRHGLTPLLATSTEAAGDLPALTSLLKGRAQVLYLPPTTTAARYAPQVLAWGRERRLRVVSSRAEDQERGAVLQVALDYQALGQETASLVRRVLAGEKPEHIPIREHTPVKIILNETLWRYWSSYPGASGTCPRSFRFSRPSSLIIYKEEYPS